MAMTETLKIVLGFGDTDKSVTLSLPDPVDNLTRTQVNTAMSPALTNDIIAVNGSIADKISKVYIHRQEDVELV